MGNNLSDQEKKTDSVKFIEVSLIFKPCMLILTYELILQSLEMSYTTPSMI